MGSKALRRMAQENLLPGEDVIYAGNVMRVEEDGKSEALFVVTDSRVLCCSRKLVARELVEFPYLNIQSMQIKGKVFDKELHIKSLTETVIISATLAELNKIKAGLQALIEYDLNARSEQVSVQTAVEELAKVDDDMENQLCTLKRLLDDGLLTPEEYNAKKQQLLGL